MPLKLGGLPMKLFSNRKYQYPNEKVKVSSMGGEATRGFPPNRENGKKKIPCKIQPIYYREF